MNQTLFTLWNNQASQRRKRAWTCPSSKLPDIKVFDWRSLVFRLTGKSEMVDWLTNGWHDPTLPEESPSLFLVGGTVAFSNSPQMGDTSHRAWSPSSCHVHTVHLCWKIHRKRKDKNVTWGIRIPKAARQDSSFPLIMQMKEVGFIPDPGHAMCRLSNHDWLGEDRWVY